MEVSVITTLFNYAQYIENNVQSFLNQDFADSELIIVDDGSIDSPLEVLQSYLGDRVKYIPLPSNGGYSRAKNIGIRESRGKFIVMLDADDMLTVNSISLRYHKIQEGYDFVHGPVLDREVGKKDKTSKLWNKWITSEKDATCYKHVHAQSVMLRRDVHSKVGLYDETLRYKSDREMWARIFNHGLRIGWVNEPVAIYRIHANQMHKSKAKAAINEKLQAEVDAKMERRKTDLSDVELLIENN